MKNESLANEIQRQLYTGPNDFIEGPVVRFDKSTWKEIIAALRANAAPQGEQGSDSIYNEVCAKLIITSVAEYMREVGHGDDIVNLIKSFNPKAHHTFNASLAEIDRFVNSLDDTP